MIVDAHVHLSCYRPDVATVADSRDALLEDMQKHGVDFAIVIPDNRDDQPDIAGLNVAQALIRESDPLVLLGSPDVMGSPDEELSRYTLLLEERTVHGLKFFPGHEPYYPNDERCEPFYVACEEHQLPVVFHTGENPGNPDAAKFNEPKYIVQVAQKHPSLKVVIAHLFWPRMEYCYHVTRETPNIYFELAGTADPEVVNASGGIQAVREVVSRIISERPGQVIFGTDWPMCDIKDHLTLVDSLGFDAVTESKVLGGNASAIYELH